MTHHRAPRASGPRCPLVWSPEPEARSHLPLGALLSSSQSANHSTIFSCHISTWLVYNDSASARRLFCGGEQTMASAASIIRPSNKEYPTSDGRPMAETDYHRDQMTDSIKTLQAFFADEPMVYVSGNLLIFYVPGNKRRHVSPDVFVVFGVKKGKRL